MPTVTITTSLTRPPVSPNAREHWQTRRRIANEVRTEVMYRTRGAGVPTGLDHITVTCHYRPADKRGLWDRDNLRAGFKPVYDALTARGTGPAHPVVADDTEQYMTMTDPVQHDPIKGKAGAVWLVIEWADAEAEEVVPC